MTIFYVQYEVVPAASSELFASVGGALVNCWVKAESEGEAQEQASAVVRESGWAIVTIEEDCCQVNEQWYSNSDEGLEYYKQAVVDGSCYVFHQWPVEVPDESDAN